MFALVACERAEHGDGYYGPRADAELVEKLERARLYREDVGRDILRVVAAVDGDVALLGDNPGEGWATSIYRRDNGRWRWVADKGNSPAPCLFVAAHAGAEQTRRLSDHLYAIAPGMKPDIEPVPCRFKALAPTPDS